MQNDETKKTKSGRRLFVVGSLTIILIAGYFYWQTQAQTKLVRINNHTITIEVADTDEERQRGLCCRDFLGENKGMLFIYDQPGDYRFWMKDTRVPLDMYWIASNKRIVHIEKNVRPETYPQTFGTNKSAQYILETNAGFADSRNIKTGDLAEFNL